MTQQIIAATPAPLPIPGMRGFLKQIAGLALTMLLAVALGLYVKHLRLMVFYAIGYSPILAVSGYFVWLRSFHPQRVPAELPVNSPQYIKLKRTGRICLFTAIGMLALLTASMFVACLCDNEFLAAHFTAWMCLVAALIYVPFAATLGISHYLRERNKRPGSMAFSWQQQHPRRSGEAPLWRSYLKPIHSEHWGNRELSQTAASDHSQAEPEPELISR